MSQLFLFQSNTLENPETDTFASGVLGENKILDMAMMSHEREKSTLKNVTFGVETEITSPLIR